MVGSSQSVALSVSLLVRCKKPHLDLRPELYTITSPAVALNALTGRSRHLIDVLMLVLS